MSAAESKKKVGFHYTVFTVAAPGAKKIFLTGDFNDWQEEKTAMKPGRDGVWQKRLRLGPGRYQYRFIVDGNWQDDPGNQWREANPFGSDNSVIEIS